MIGYRFADLQSQALLARYFKLPEHFFSDFLAANRHDFYLRMLIPKRSSGQRFRTVHKVTDRFLKSCQKQLAYLVSESCEPLSCVHGFFRDRSIVSNAVSHVGARIVLHVDIREFFESIRDSTVAAKFVSLGASNEAAALLAQIATLDGVLVQGVSSSPAISNAVCAEMDASLQLLAESIGAVYTRYADDLTFSGSYVPSVADVSSVLEKHEFSIATEKLRVQRKGRFQYVTGLCVSDKERPRAPRRMKKWLRSVVHAAGKYGLEATTRHLEHPLAKSLEIARIDGSIAFLYSVEPIVAAKLDRVWQPALFDYSPLLPHRKRALYQAGSS